MPRRFGVRVHRRGPVASQNRVADAACSLASGQEVSCQFVRHLRARCLHAFECLARAQVDSTAPMRPLLVVQSLLDQCMYKAESVATAATTLLYQLRR